MATFGPDIKVSDGAIEQIANLIGDKSAEELKKLGDDGSLLMKKYALDFIEVIKASQEEITQLEQTALSLRNKRRSLKVAPGTVENPVEVQQYIEAREKFKQQRLANKTLDNFYAASMIFNAKIIEIITGHKAQISIVFLDADGNPIILDIPMEKILQGDKGISITTDISSAKIPRLAGRLKISVDKVKTDLAEAIRKDSIIGAQSLKGLNEAYKETDADYKKWKPHIFWKIDTENIWYKLTIGGAAGDIAEAYAYFFYTGGEGSNPNTLFLGRVYNRNMDYFIREGVINVDNVSGLYASDITTNEYDYAVKSLNASLPGYTQMVTLANQILNNKIKTVSELKQISLQKQYKDPIEQNIRKGLRNKVEVVATNEVPKQIKQTIGVKI